MRRLFYRALIATTAAASACAEAPPAPDAPPAPAAVSVQRFAFPAIESTHLPPHGYSETARRAADCLASYPGYDVRTDRIEVRRGVTRRCPL